MFLQREMSFYHSINQKIYNKKIQFVMFLGAECYTNVKSFRIKMGIKLESLAYVGATSRDFWLRD